MSVFSKIRLSKKAAQQHKEKEKGKGKEVEPVKAAYKHIPTHAAFDALSGAPSSWKHEDRPKIREQNQRRSQMAISRTGSSLSTATMAYMNAATNMQAPPLPRNNSYSSHNPTWFDRGGDLHYSFEKNETGPKRQRTSRGHSYHDSGIGSSVRPSPLASNIASEEVSPIISSGNSTTSTSSDNLEMPRNPNRMSVRPQPIIYAEKDIFDKLHRSTTRKVGEAPLYDSPPIVAKAVPTTPAVPQQKQKKNRWSLLGKKNNAISAI